MHGAATSEHDGIGDDPRHTFLDSKAVFARYDWGRTYGYQMLNSTGFPRSIGGVYRLDTLMVWEDRVLAGELPGVPDAKPSPEASAPPQVTELPVRRNSRRKRAA